MVEEDPVAKNSGLPSIHSFGTIHLYCFFDQSVDKKTSSFNAIDIKND